MAAVFLFGLGISETYQREIPRRRAKRLGIPLNQGPALSGTTIEEMFRITVIDPIRMFVTDPIVTLSTVYLLFNFAVVFQWFISVPAALGGMPYDFSLKQIGLAFTTALAGAALAAVMTIMIEQIGSGMFMKMLGRKDTLHHQSIEYRLVPAMIGQFIATGSLFWIGKCIDKSEDEDVMLMLLQPSPSDPRHS